MYLNHENAANLSYLNYNLFSFSSLSQSTSTIPEKDKAGESLLFFFIVMRSVYSQILTLKITALGGAFALYHGFVVSGFGKKVFVCN